MQINSNREDACIHWTLLVLHDIGRPYSLCLLERSFSLRNIGRPYSWCSHGKYNFLNDPCWYPNRWFRMNTNRKILVAWTMLDHTQFLYTCNITECITRWFVLLICWYPNRRFGMNTNWMILVAWTMLDNTRFLYTCNITECITRWFILMICWYPNRRFGMSTNWMILVAWTMLDKTWFLHTCNITECITRWFILMILVDIQIDDSERIQTGWFSLLDNVW